jgi:hypothetical protein
MRVSLDAPILDRIPAILDVQKVQRTKVRKNISVQYFDYYVQHRLLLNGALLAKRNPDSSLRNLVGLKSHPKLSKESFHTDLFGIGVVLVETMAGSKMVGNLCQT